VRLSDLLRARWPKLVVQFGQVGVEKIDLSTSFHLGGNGTLGKLGQGEAKVLRSSVQIIGKPDVDSASTPGLGLDRANSLSIP
jgi:hypothetical protein